MIESSWSGAGVLKYSIWVSCFDYDFYTASHIFKGQEGFLSHNYAFTFIALRERLLVTAALELTALIFPGSGTERGFKSCTYYSCLNTSYVVFLHFPNNVKAQLTG